MQWMRIFQYSVLVGGTGVLWTLGLALCGPLRTILLWEHSEIAMLSAVGSLFTLGSAKGRSTIFFLVGLFVLLFFDNDHVTPPTMHRQLLTSYLSLNHWILSFQLTNLQKGVLSQILSIGCLHL